MLHASPITADLWVGAAPPPGYYSARFDAIYLVANEYQPPAEAFPGVLVRRFPFDDVATPSSRDLKTAWAAATRVTEDISAGRRVLVTCSMGRNRSALVAAIALHMMTGITGAQAASIVRARRTDKLGVRALANPEFLAFMKSLR